MRTWAPLAFPVALLAILLPLFGFCPGTASWGRHGVFVAMPHVLLAASFVLGACFGQSRICFVSLLLSATTFAAHYAHFVKPDPVQGETTLLLSAVYLPALTALFYRLDERGLLSLGGGVRGLAIVLSAALVLFLLPRIQALNQAVAGVAARATVRPSGAGSVAAAGGLALALSAPFLLIPRQHESPLLGPTLCLSLVFALLAMCFRAALWRAPQQATVLLGSMSGAALTLILAVMETSWRNANLDELTQLPGRRSLKLRLERLGPAYAIAVADLDHFKKINDRHGHDVGDQVLRFVASRLRRIAVGTAYRHGGEEFAVVCEDVPFADFLDALEDVRLAVGGREFGVRRRGRPRRKPETVVRVAVPGGVENVPVTISIGAAESGRGYATPHEVMDAADRALYRAKRDGRNCVRTSQPPEV
jgi:diguanylate cyclase (GGDEF)-like protein